MVPTRFLKKCFSDHNRVKSIFEKNLFGAEKNQNDFAEILSLIEKRKGIDLAKASISRYHISALKNLEIFSDSVFKQNLIAILNYSSERIL